VDIYWHVCCACAFVCVNYCHVTTLQLQAQYVFIHDALEELITCGDTSFSAQNMRVKVNRMSKVNPETEITGYQKQFQVEMIHCYKLIHYWYLFQVLEKVSRKLNVVDCSDAQMQCNKAKNRFEDIIPCKSLTSNVQYN